MKKNSILVALAVVAFLNGATSQYLEPGVAFSRADIWYMFIAVSLSFGWYYLDSQQIGYQRSKWLNVGIIGIGVLALPYYFFRSRGFTKGFLCTVLFIMFAVAWSALQMGGAYAVYYGIQS